MQNILDIHFSSCYPVNYRHRRELFLSAVTPRKGGSHLFMKNLRLKLARMEKDMSQTELAKRVGVTRQTIGMVESGDYNPTLNLCIQICKELGKTLNDLFWEDNDNEMV